jgi:hypothetical protein
MMLGLYVMTVSHMGMVPSFLVAACLMMFGRRAMVFRGVFMVLGGFVIVISKRGLPFFDSTNRPFEFLARWQSGLGLFSPGIIR